MHMHMPLSLCERCAKKTERPSLAWLFCAGVDMLCCSAGLHTRQCARGASRSFLIRARMLHLFLFMCVCVCLSSVASRLCFAPRAHRVQKAMGKANGEAGHSNMLYIRVAAFASRLSAQDRDTCCLIYDEINTVGDLAFKIVNGEYVFYGLVSESIREALFIPPKGATVEEALKAKQATHALVFQVTTISAAKFRFVCGIHPVASLTAVVLEQLFWETVKNLYLVCCITIVASITSVLHSTKRCLIPS
jgi:hypothetical protein